MAIYASMASRRFEQGNQYLEKDPLAASKQKQIETQIYCGQKMRLFLPLYRNSPK